MIQYMLDTDTVIYTIKNRPANVRKFFHKNEDRLCISSITWGELVYGCERSTRPEQNYRDIEGLAARMTISKFDDQAAFHFGQIRSELYSKGKPIGPYDMQIAGHARALGLILVTNNEKEFSRVSGLRIENWV